MRPRNRRNPAAALTAYWSASRAGAPREELGRLAEALDPEVVETVERMREARIDPHPESAFVARLETDLLRAYQDAHRETVRSSVATVQSRAHMARPPVQRRSAVSSHERPRWTFVRLAIVLLFVLLPIGLVARERGALPFASRTGRPPMISAPLIPTETPPVASPVPGITRQTLVATSFPAATLPPHAEVILAQATWQPGTAQDSALAPGGVGFDYVIAGSFAASSDAPMLVVSAGGSSVPVRPGAEATLGPGDAAVYLDMSVPSRQRNAGSGPLTLLYVAVFSLAQSASIAATPVIAGTPSSDAVNTNMDDAFAFLQEAQWSDLATGTVTASIERVTIAPGATLPALDGPGYRLVGAPGYYFGDSGLLNGPLASDDSTPLQLYVLTLRPIGGAATPSSDAPNF